ncbi:MAG: ligase-associated DNA damage response DEXH box helicase [Rhodobiaceae bacterium]|nr:ligase-associated DNA damage response DEXH box helicase [Rhodobiaceae bacterium]MCC0055083.1 ligase-associated DNA damage response DEXH box helicase [Rhodobiaceae bacterium]
MDAPAPLPDRFERWFASRGWRLRGHQQEMIERAGASRSVLLIAPTGAGKTLAGFLPSLIALSQKKSRGLHTLYVSPLKALAVDIARNLEAPIAEMGLDIKVETRTGDTPASRRQRQKRTPPDILVTTPEQIALLIASREAETLFGNLQTVIFDELHALVTSKRGDLLALGLARLRQFSPGLRTVGLSATVADPPALAGWLVPQTGRGTAVADIVMAPEGAAPNVEIMKASGRIPWAGHMAAHALEDIYRLVAGAGLALIFVNTRAQAEKLFQDLWRINDDGLAIALHHGSLDVGQRRKVEAAMAAGTLRAVVATATLDLGIDWGDVDLVINVGAPKGASRLAQRIGRANHRLDEPSRAVLVPANRFEVMECEAAVEALAEGAQDSPPPRTGGLDVLAQHLLGLACGSPFSADDVYGEITGSWPYRDLDRPRFDRVLDFVATGGYALRTYDRYARIRQTPEGLWRVANPRVAQQYRLNVGTIVEAPMLKVRLVRTGRRARVGGRVLGEIEEWFIEQLGPSDTFMFAGEVLRFEGLAENSALVSRAVGEDPRIPSYQGGKFPLSTYLADRVRAMLADPANWAPLPGQVREWLEIQQFRSRLPGRDDLLVETFPRGNRFYLVCYPFEGRLCHQSLGMLLTRRLERAGARPLGFVASEYALAIWGIGDYGGLIGSGRLSLPDLFDEDMLGDDLDAWLAESNLMKRTFRNVATIAGLIERRYPGQEKTGRQMTVSSDLIYDVLRSHEPDHILLEATYADAASGLLDIARLGQMLKRISGHIIHQPLSRVSPLAVPVMLEIGREPVYGEANEALLALGADELIEEAIGEV